MSDPTSVRSDEGTLGSLLEIQIEASNLANMDVFSLSDPFAILEERRNGKWMELGKPGLIPVPVTTSCQKTSVRDSNVHQVSILAC